MSMRSMRSRGGGGRWLSQVAVAAMVGTSALVFGLSAQAVEVGQAAPKLPAAAASATSAAAPARPLVTYVDFWASWCGPCRESFPWMNAMQAKYGAQGLRIVGVNVDQKPEDMVAFLKEFPASFEVISDAKGEQPKAWGVKGMPTAYLLDAQGVVRKVHMGFKRAQADELEASIRDLLQAAKGGAR